MQQDYQIIKITNMWSTDRLRQQAEETVNARVRQGWEVVSVSFGLNLWWIPTVFITIRK